MDLGSVNMIKKYSQFLATFFLLSINSLISHAQLPTEPSLIHGQVHIDLINYHLTITNTPNTILDWQSFSIGPQDSVYFQQQDATSQILNRVIGSDPSHIFGNLSSNGRVWLVNPYGVLFGPDTRIDVAGLITSTLDISNIDFLANRHQFYASGHTGEVKNQGEIRTTLGGRVWLIGDQVSNEGLIQTPTGQIVLAAGKSIELVDSGAPNVIVKVKASENETINLGSLVAANGGKIDLHGSIVNQEGIVRANSLSADAAGHIVLTADQISLATNSETQANKGFIQMKADATLNNWGLIKGNYTNLVASEIFQEGQIVAYGGNINLVGDNYTYLDGLIDVSNVQGTGGTIKLLTGKLEGTAGAALRADGLQGGNIALESNTSSAFSSPVTAIGSTQGGRIDITGDSILLLNADIDVSGGTKGGIVYLGKDKQAVADTFQATREVLIGVGSEVRASGGDRGGEINVFSTEISEQHGSLQALDGGSIKLASNGEIHETGEAKAGIGGTVLFDTNKLSITDNPPDNVTFAHKVTSGSLNGQPKLAAGDNFGSAVALDGDLLAVGAANDSSSGSKNQGAIYLFNGVGSNFSGLTLQKKVTSELGAIGMPSLSQASFFGSAVAIDGDHLVVGARGDVLNEISSGAVYLFTGVGSDFSGLTWKGTIASGEGALSMPKLSEFDFFGSALALQGDRLVIGAAGDSFRGSNQGAVHLFTGVGTDFSNLTWKEKLTSGERGMPELRNSDFFGWSLAMDGDLLAVGAINDSTGGTNRGAVHLFTGVGTDFSNLTWKEKLASGERGMPELKNSDFFGWSLALRGDRLIVGALGDDGEKADERNRGAVHLFTGVGSDYSKLNWQYKIAPNRNSDESGFGLSVALDENRLAVGTIGESSLTGAMYLIDLFNPIGNSTGRQATLDTAIQGVNTAVLGARAVLDGVGAGSVIDTVSQLATSSFGRVNLAQMGFADMLRLLESRREFKEKLFADALYKLELDPRLSDVPECLKIEDAALGLCRISDKQRDELKSKQLKAQKPGRKITRVSLPQIERKLIVLFGIDQYADQSIPSLENAIADIEAIGNVFSNQLGYEVRSVKNASRADMIATLNQLATQMEANDSVVIYFAGHGYLNEKTKMGYWIPADASAKDPRSWIANSDISIMLTSINSKQIVMISDSCYSGAFAKEQQLLKSDTITEPTEILTKRSVVVMSSGGDEPVADEGKDGHSIFAWYLIQTLRDINNWKPGTSIFEQVQREVSNSFPQTPQYGAAISAGHQKGGDYLFEFRKLE